MWSTVSACAICLVLSHFVLDMFCKYFLRINKWRWEISENTVGRHHHRYSSFILALTVNENKQRKCVAVAVTGPDLVGTSVTLGNCFGRKTSI